MRERWLGATRRRVPQIVLEGDLDLADADPLFLEDVSDVARLEEAHAAGRPVVVRAESAQQVLGALARPEVSCVLVPASARELLALDLTELTYG